MTATGASADSGEQLTGEHPGHDRDPIADSGSPQGSSGRVYLRLVGLGAAVGIPAALVAAAFLALVHESEVWLWTDLPRGLGADSPPWYLVIGLPVLGALIVWIARRFLPGDGGHAPLDGVSTAPTPWRYAPGVALAAFGTLAFGGILGPEAPLIALGSAVGMIVNRFARLDSPGERVVATAGSFSAISAMFGSPLVAGMLLLEAGVVGGGGVSGALIAALLPGLVAAAVGYVLFVGLGNWGGLESSGLTVGNLPAYTGTHLLDLLLAVVVGVVATLIMVPIRQLAGRASRSAPAGKPMNLLGLLLLGGAAVGLLAQATHLLGGDSELILFSGQASIPALIGQDSVLLLLVILVAKGLGYVVCLGCGFRGGPVFPAIFLAIGIATFAVTVLGASPTWAVAVGAAAGTTASTGLVFTSLIFATILVGSNGLDALPAAVLAAVAAWLTNAALDRRARPIPATAEQAHPTQPAPDGDGQGGDGARTHHPQQKPREAASGEDQQ